MALNLDTTFKLKAKVEGARAVDQFKKQIKGLDTSSKMSKAQLGKMNIEINRMARAAGNTTRGLREHIKALTILRDRTDIGGKAYKRLGTQIDTLKRKLKGLDGQAISTGNRLAGMLGTLGIGRLIRGSITGAMDYEEELKKTAAIEGGGNYQQIEQAVASTAQVAAGTPQQVATLATSLARAGFDADQISGSLNNIVAGAEATGTAFDVVGGIVADNINSFGLEIEDTSALMDILVAGANGANQTIEDLGVSLKYAAPVANAFNLTVNDTVATISLLAQAGIRGSDAGTALRTGLTRLQLAATGAEGRLKGVSRGTQQLVKGFTALSSEILDANGQLKPMDQVLIALKRDLEGIEDLGQRAEITTAIFGKEQGSKFLAMLGRTEQEITNMFEATRNSEGVTLRTREAMDSFGLTTKVLGGNLQVVTNQIGAAFIQVLEPMAKGLNTLLTIASRLPTPIKGFASAAAAAGLAALALKTTMIALNITLGKTVIYAKVVAFLTAVKKGFYAATVAVNIFNLSNPVGWAIILTTATVALIAVIVRFRKQIANLAKAIYNIKILADIRAFMKEKVIAPIIEVGKEFRKMVMENIIKVWNMLPPWLRKFITGTADKIKVIAVNVVEDVKEAGSNILGGEGEGNPLEKQSDFAKGATSAIEEYRQKALDVAGNVKNAFNNAFQKMEDALVNFVMTGKLAFGDLARSIIQDMARIVIQQTIMAPFTGWLSSIFGNAKGNVIQDGETKKFAYGGVVTRPTMFPMKNGMGLMGEAGAEAIMPLQRGRNGKLGVQASGGVGNVVVNVDATGSSVQGDETQGKQLGKLIAVAIQSELVQQQRPGGLLA